MDLKPKKIIVYYDVVSNQFLIRVVDKDFKDIAVYDMLPVMCRISDLHIKVIEVDSCIPRGNVLIINNEYYLGVDDNFVITEVSNFDGLVYMSVDEDNSTLKEIFSHGVKSA